MFNNIEHEEYLSRNILSRKSQDIKEPKKLKKDKHFYMNLKEGLIHKYKGVDLLDLPGASVFENEYGEALKITYTDKIRKLNIKSDYDRVYSNLKLLKGIGEKTEIKLKNQGYNTLHDLKSHDRYGESASLLISNLDSEDFINCVKSNSKDRRDYLSCASRIPLDKFKFMDIETLGLFNTYVILIGLAELKGSKLVSSQYFLRDYSEEPVILAEYFKHLSDDSVLVTFNGKQFDVPFINTRSRRYRIGFSDWVNFDLLYYVKSFWGDKLSNCKLQTVESEIFDYNRVDDVPGAFVPDFWKTFHDTSNIGPVVPIIEHNRIDILNLVCFLSKLSGEL